MIGKKAISTCILLLLCWIRPAAADILTFSWPRNQPVDVFQVYSGQDTVLMADVPQERFEREFSNDQFLYLRFSVSDMVINPNEPIHIIGCVKNVDQRTLTCDTDLVATGSIVDTVPPCRPAPTPGVVGQDQFQGERPFCCGDCNGDRKVTVNEQILAINILMGRQPLSQCPHADCNPTNGVVNVSDVIMATNNLLGGCP